MPDSLPLPSAPPNFTVVGLANGQGRYVLGHDKFFVSSNLHITSRFQRDLTINDDVYLGLLSVVLIAIFSDILHTFILRSSRDTARSRIRLVCAFLLSEFAHFRNVLKHCAPIHRILLANQQQHRGHQQFQSWMPPLEREGNGGTTPLTVTLSVKILFFTSLLFIADFLSIFYTQQSALISESDQFNLVAYHPISATLGQSKYIRRLIGDRPCVSPFMISTDTRRVRNYQLITCVKLTFGYSTVDGNGKMKVETTSSAAAAVAGIREGGGGDEEDKGGGNNDAGVARNVVIDSFFHRGGSDHNILYEGVGGGDVRFLSVSVRAQVVVSKASGGARRILFRRVKGDYLVDDDVINNNNNNNNNNKNTTSTLTNTTTSKSSPSSSYPLTAHIHRLVIHGASEWACRKHLNHHQSWCKTQLRHYNPPSPSNTTTSITTYPPHYSVLISRDVYLWRGKNGDVTQHNAKGLRTTFTDINLPNATWALNAGVRWLVSAGYVQEERGKGKYVRVTNDTEEDGIGGLLTEYGRQLGVVSMMMMVGVAVVVMLLCRVCLRPISLGEVVITNLDREGGGDGGGAREVGGGKGKGVGEVEDMMMVVGDDKTVVGAKDGEINTYGRKRMSDGGDGGGGGGWTTKHGHGHGYDYCHAPGPGPRRPPEITAVIGSGDCDNDVAIVGARTGRGGVTAAAAPTTRGPQQQRNSRRLAFLTRGSSTDADKAAQQTIGMVVGAGSTMAYSYNSDDND